MNSNNRPQKRTYDDDYDSNAKRRSRENKFYGKLNVLVPTDCVGMLTGKNGCTLREMADESGAKFYLQPYDELVRGSKDRGLRLTGTWEQLKAAQLLVLEKLIQRQPLEELLPLPDGHELAKWYIPSDMCGMLIGKGGETIKNINESSGSRLKLDQEDECFPGSGERLIWISGPPEGNKKAQKMIKERAGGNATPTQKPPDESNHLIPCGCIGTIIGPGGATVKALCEDSGAKITVISDSELPMGLLEVPVKLSGSEEAVEKAKELIAAKVQKWQEENPDEAGLSDDLLDKNTTIKITIPQLLVGHLIGKKGGIINDINASVNYGRCKVLPKAKAPSTVEDQKVVVFGGTIRAMLEVQKKVMDRLSTAPDFLIEQAESARLDQRHEPPDAYADQYSYERREMGRDSGYPSAQGYGPSHPIGRERERERSRERDRGDRDRRSDVMVPRSSGYAPYRPQAMPMSYSQPIPVPAVAPVQPAYVQQPMMYQMPNGQLVYYQMSQGALPYQYAS